MLLKLFYSNGNCTPPEPANKSIVNFVNIDKSLHFCKQTCKQKLCKALISNVFLFAKVLTNLLQSNYNNKQTKQLVLCNVLKVAILAKKPAKKKRVKPIGLFLYLVLCCICMFIYFYLIGYVQKTVTLYTRFLNMYSKWRFCVYVF